MDTKKQVGGARFGAGRPPKVAGAPATSTVSIKLSVEQKDKLSRLGGAPWSGIASTKPKIRNMNDLLSIEDIATMHHCSRRHAHAVLVRLPGFPAEAPTSTPRSRLWLRIEVIDFIHRR